VTGYAVVFSPEARDDLLQLYSYIAERSVAERAMGYIERIEAACQDLSTFPDRGTRRDELFPGLRIIGFERRIAIAFHIEPDTVTIDRILYGGRDLGLVRP
jgi:toxin ParE1/3/4